jgi:hypothetical protein
MSESTIGARVHDATTIGTGPKPWVDGLARVGLVARGVVYVIVGVIAFQLAFGDREASADSRGALQVLADQTFGTFLLAALAVGVACYALTCALGAVRGRGGKKAGESDTKDRLLDAWRAIANGAIAVAAVQLVIGSGSSSGGDEKEKEVTARVLDLPFGVALVVAAGLGFVAFGVMQVRKAITRKFTKGLDFGRLPDARARRVELFGVAGYAARGVVAGVIGVFLIQAAVRHDPDKTVGIDGALSELADSGPGPALLVAVALGLMAFGLWSMVEGWLRRPTD